MALKLRKLRKAREFRCDACRRTFWSQRSQREIEGEYQKNFPGELRAEPGALCDECWRTFRLGYG